MSACPLCNGTFIVCTGGPDYWGNYDTDDCPCQTGMTADDIARMVDNQQPERNTHE